MRDGVERDALARAVLRGGSIAGVIWCWCYICNRVEWAVFVYFAVVGESESTEVTMLKLTREVETRVDERLQAMPSVMICELRRASDWPARAPLRSRGTPVCDLPERARGYGGPTAAAWGGRRQMARRGSLQSVPFLWN